MRSRHSITAVLALAAATVWAEIRFTQPLEFPDLSLAMPLLEGAAANPAEMPRAEAYLVTEREDAGSPAVLRLEDRYNPLDLWMAETLRGRWNDDAGNAFQVFRLSLKAPEEAPSATVTRSAFRKNAKPLDPEDMAQVDAAVAAAVPSEITRAIKPRRAMRHNLSTLREYETADGRALVFAFRPRPPDRTAREKPPWYAIALAPADGEDIDAARKAIDDALDDIFAMKPEKRAPGKSGAAAEATETDLLCSDLRRSVANYAEWHFAAADDVMVTDDLDPVSRSGFIVSLTNDLPRLRAAYASAVPPPLDDAFHPAAVRVFRDRGEYLAYAGAEQKWTAAIWSPQRRELVLHLPASGTAELLRTVRHEAFHQYLSYAGAMLQAAPWFNEGHAELFEHTRLNASGGLEFTCDPEAALFINGRADELADFIPALTAMDYWPREGEAEGFYSGTQEARLLKYRLAWSIAYFLQVGAPEVRFRPFENLRADYMKALVRTRSGAAATAAVLDGGTMKNLVDEWRTFWKKQ